MTKEESLIEWAKIIIGIIGAIIAGLWTWYTFTDDRRIAENEAISKLDNAISGIIVNCFVIDINSKLTNISDLPSQKNELHSQENELFSPKNEFEIACIQYFQQAFKLSKSARIHITKPKKLSNEDWEEMWKELNKSLKDSYVSEYNEISIETAWTSILNTIIY